MAVVISLPSALIAGAIAESCTRSCCAAWHTLTLIRLELTAASRFLLSTASWGMSRADIEEQFRRMVFIIVARNRDDHVKNIAFPMDQSRKWSLSPAFDMTYSYQPIK